MEEYQDRSLGGRVFKRLREDILLFSFCMIVYDYTNIVKMISC